MGTKTLVKTMAFGLGFSKNVLIDDFFKWTVNFERTPQVLGGYKHYIICDTHDNYIVGLILSLKGDRRILATRNENEKLNVDKIELAKNQDSTQATMFCLEPSSKSGMLFNYHGGVPITTFSKLFEKIHNKARNELVNLKAREIARSTSPNRSHKRKAEDYYSGRFNFNLKVKELDIKALLDDFSKFNSLSISISKAVPDGSIFRPLMPHSKKSHVTFNLSDSKNSKSVRDAIMEVWNGFKEKHAIEAFKVIGRSLYGTELQERLGENVEHFHQMYLDDYIDLLPEDEWRNYIDSDALHFLIEKVQEHPAVIPLPMPLANWKKSKTRKDLDNE